MLLSTVRISGFRIEAWFLLQQFSVPKPCLAIYPESFLCILFCPPSLGVLEGIHTFTHLDTHDPPGLPPGSQISAEVTPKLDSCVSLV